MHYDWRHDVNDLTDDEEIRALGWDCEAVDTAFYMAADTIAADEGGDVYEAMENIICLWYISDGSKLSRYLDAWHELHGRDTWDAVRDYTECWLGFLFVTGLNYDLMDRDLLGDYYEPGATSRIFGRFVEAMEGVGAVYMPRYMNLDMGARERHVIEHLRDVKCLQAADGGKAVVKFVGDDGSGFDTAYDPKKSRWFLC